MKATARILENFPQIKKCMDSGIIPLPAEVISEVLLNLEVVDIKWAFVTTDLFIKVKFDNEIWVFKYEEPIWKLIEERFKNK